MYPYARGSQIFVIINFELDNFGKEVHHYFFTSTIHKCNFLLIKSVFKFIRFVDTDYIHSCIFSIYYILKTLKYTIYIFVKNYIVYCNCEFDINFQLFLNLLYKKICMILFNGTFSCHELDTNL